MKNQFKIFFALSFLVSILSGCNSNEGKPIICRKDVISDMALMYYGGAHRHIEWNKEQTMSLVSYRDDAGKRHWLFDGFLMLEYKDGKGRGFASYYEPLPTRKIEWQALCDKYFTPDVALSAINQNIEEVAREIGKPKHKRKVVLTLHEPQPNQKDWGVIDGETLDFSKDEDRIKACKWYIDYSISKFNDADFKNLELNGFYWIAEEATNSRTIVHALGDYMREKGYKFYWIPFWGSDGHGEWKELKFDYAYQQPNYFFKDVKPDADFLPMVCRFAAEKEMFLELEFDERAMRYQTDYRADRLVEYVEAFQACGAWNNQPIAYYIGDCMVYSLKTSADPEDKALYKWFVNEVGKRQIIRGEK